MAMLKGGGKGKGQGGKGNGPGGKGKGKGKGKGVGKGGPPQPPSGWNQAAYTWTFDKIKQTQNERKHGGGTAYFNAHKPNVTLHVHLELNQRWDKWVNLCWSDTKSMSASDGNYTNKSAVRDKCKQIKSEWAKAFNENNKKKKK